MPIIPVEEAGDSRLSDYLRLRDVSLRKLLETDQGLFIAEGEKVIRRALQAGYRPRSFLLAERWLAGLADVIQRWPDAPVYLVTEAAGRNGHRLSRAPRGLGVAAPRTAATAGGSAAIGSSRGPRGRGRSHERRRHHAQRGRARLGRRDSCSPRAADPLYRRAIKVSMGAVFSLPWARFSDWAGAPELLRQSGFRTVALTLTPDAIDLDAARMELGTEERVAIMLGTEGDGLSAAWTRGAELRVKIPMSVGIDSLNVAAASAIACYVLGPLSAGSRGVTGQSLG